MNKRRMSNKKKMDGKATKAKIHSGILKFKADRNVARFMIVLKNAGDYYFLKEFKRYRDCKLALYYYGCALSLMSNEKYNGFLKGRMKVIHSELEGKKQIELESARLLLPLGHNCTLRVDRTCTTCEAEYRATVVDEDNCDYCVHCYLEYHYGTANDDPIHDSMKTKIGTNPIELKEENVLDCCKENEKAIDASIDTTEDHVAMGLKDSMEDNVATCSEESMENCIDSASPYQDGAAFQMESNVEVNQEVVEPVLGTLIKHEDVQHHTETNNMKNKTIRYNPLYLLSFSADTFLNVDKAMLDHARSNGILRWDEVLVYDELSTLLDEMIYAVDAAHSIQQAKEECIYDRRFLLSMSTMNTTSTLPSQVQTTLKNLQLCKPSTCQPIQPPSSPQSIVAPFFDHCKYQKFKTELTIQEQLDWAQLSL